MAIFSHFLFIGTVNAQALQGYVSDCLKVEASGHTAQLSIKTDGEVKAFGDKPIYVMVCITSELLGKTRCTTGNGALDMELFNQSEDFNALVAHNNRGDAEEGDTVGGVVGGQSFEAPRMTTPDGVAFTAPVSWHDQYHPGVIHQWSWIQAADAGGAGGVETGGLGAQQQGTFDFSRISGDTTKCAKIGWDPRGYVFDAITLNPVRNVEVTLSTGPKGGVYTDVVSGSIPGLVNPITTRPLTAGGELGNGQYSFYVEPGFYKLRISSPNAVIADVASINSAYQDLYIFDDKQINGTGKAALYQTNQEIEEKAGEVAVRQIPVTITDQSLLITKLEKLKTRAAGGGDGQINLFGNVTHPKTKMTVTLHMIDEEGNPVTVVKNEITTNLGEYDVYYDQEVVDANGKTLIFESADVSFELNPFFTTGVFAKKDSALVGLIHGLWKYISNKITVNAATNDTSFSVKAIPTYLEGIAYDSLGKAIPQAIIGVYTEFSSKPWFITVADEEGRYKIGSQYLPRFEYELRYKKPTGEIIVVDTSTFIKQNIKFFVAEGIKPYGSKKSSSTEDYATQVKVSEVVKKTDLEAMAKVGSSKGIGLSKSGSDGGTGATQITSSPTGGAGLAGSGVMMIAVVIFILVLLGAGAFVMMKSKQTTTQF